MTTGSTASAADDRRQQVAAAIRAAWSAALGGAEESLDPTTTFLAAGGHSLAAGRLIAQLRGDLGVDVPMSAILRDNPTLDQMLSLVAEQLSESSPAAEVIRPDCHKPSGERSAPLTPNLRRIWTWHRLYPESPAYNVVRVLEIEGQLRPATLRTSLQDLAARHEALRCGVSEPAAGCPRVEIEAEVQPVLKVEVVTAEMVRDRFGRDVTEWAAEIEPALHRIADESFAMTRPPLWRVGLVWVPALRRSYLILVMHHLISDLRTTDLMLADLAQAYAARDAGVEPHFAAAPPSLIGHLQYEQSLVDSSQWQGDLNWWSSRLEGVTPAPALPLSGVNRDDAHFAATPHTARLDSDTSMHLDYMLRDRGLTPALLFLTAAAGVLASWTGMGGRTEVIGLPSQRQSRPADAQLVGFLLDTLPLPITIDRDASFLEAYRNLRDTYSDAVDRAAPPFDDILDRLRLPRSGHNPLIRLWFSDLTQATTPSTFGNLTITEYDLAPSWALFDLAFYLGRGPDGYRLHLVSPDGLCAPPDVAALVQQVVTLAADAAVDPERSMADLLTPSPKAVLKREGSHPGSVSAAASTSELLRRHAKQGRPEALVDASGQLSYRELDDAVDEAAARIAPGSVVTVSATRQRALVIELLACWRVGATAVLVDAEWPEQRRHRVDEAIAGWPPQNPENAEGRHVLFTSGTTGLPLAVQVSARVADAALADLGDLVGVRPTDRVAMLSAAAHDPVLRDIGLALRSGGQICIPPPTAFGAPRQLAEWLREQRISVVSASPVLLALLMAVVAEPLPALRVVISGGSPLSRATADLVRRRAPSALLVNGYGSTETPQLVAAEVIAPHELLPPTADVPIGRPLPGRRLEVRQPDGRPCSVGQLGEIWVSAPYLADGYLTSKAESGTVDVTLDRFVVDALEGGSESCWLRTGDLARADAGGLLHFAGRADRQVLVNGYRLMLEELEAVTRTAEGVSDAVAEVIGDDGAQSVRIWVQRATDADVSVEGVRMLLASVLPAIAVPSRVIVVDRLSLGANNKPVVPSSEPRPLAFDPQPDASIKQLAESVLGRSLDPNTNFFDAGFTSLTLLQLGAELSATLHRPLDPLMLFQHPNLNALSAHLNPSEAPDDMHATRTPRLKRELSQVQDHLSARRNDARRRIGNLNKMEHDQ